VGRGYYTGEEARALFGVVLDGTGAVDTAATERERAGRSTATAA
jgi:hypothetical protein